MEMTSQPFEAKNATEKPNTHDAMLSHFTKSRSSSENVTIEWNNIVFSTLIKDKVKSSLFKSVYNERKVLKGLSGSISSGELLAVLGPTGCGKTSFLNVISARLPSGGSHLMHLDGQVLVNGSPRDDKLFRAISAYVQQDDHLYAHLTVYETLILAAHFFLPTDTPLEEKDSLVTTIINDLSLRKARDTIIGSEKVRGVSGGERRRCSIASQLICDPAILFLDEPTSGLDAFQAQSVMESMKSLATLGRLVVSVIHQPRSSIYNMFDKMLLLSDGRTMYFGVASLAVDYFHSIGFDCPENFNPSDYFLDLLSPDSRTKESDTSSKDTIKKIGDLWEIKANELKASNKLAITDDINNIRLIGNESSFRKVMNNFILLAWRTWTEQSRDVFTIVIKLFFVSFFGLLLGGIYNKIGHSQLSIQNRNGLLFFLAINQCFNSLFAVLNVFPKEKLIVNRERNGRAYSALSYFIAKVLVEIPLNVLPSVVYSCIVYWLVELNPKTFGYFILILMLISFSAISLGLCVSAAAPNVETANAVGPIILVIGILFGGFYISVGSLPIVANWIPYISILRWGFEALCINEYTGLKFNCQGAKSNASCITTGEQELQILSFSQHTTSYPVFGLGMVLLGFLALAYIFLESTQITYLSLGHHGKFYSSHIETVAVTAEDGGNNGNEVGTAVPINDDGDKIEDEVNGRKLGEYQVVNDTDLEKL